MTADISSMYFDLRAGDRIEIEGCVQVEMQAKAGHIARLKITAPRTVRVQAREPTPQQADAKPVPNIAD